MRIAYVLKRFPRLSQTFVLEEMLELERQGAQLVVIAGAPSGEDLTHPQVARLAASVHYVDPSEDGDSAAQRILDAAGIEHVHAHFATSATQRAQRYAATLGLPFSFTAHATDIYRDGLDLEALTARAAAAAFVVTVTEHNRTYLETLLAEHGRAAVVRRLFNGVDLTRLRFSAAQADRRGVLAVGRLVAKKGFADLLAAVARIRPRPEVHIVGDGPLRESLLRLAEQHGVQHCVTWHGVLPHDEVLARVRRAAVVALPSVVGADGDRDALPTVITEAMALGTPVVSTTVSGIPEMIDDDVSGLLVPPHAPAALAAALERLLDDEGLRAALATAARARAERDFSLAGNVATLHQWFAESSRTGSEGPTATDRGAVR